MTPRLPPENARGTVGIGRRDLEALTRLSTPRVCDALEHVAPERRAAGHTVRGLDCAFPALPPIAGYARTALISTMAPSPDAAARYADWLEHVRSGPKPAVVVWQDIDGPDGIAASWGEVMATTHRALGCAGVVTDGAIRDLGTLPGGIQFLHRGAKPSHGWLHVVAIGCEVNVAGMTVADGDIIHADRHGAAVVPEDVVRELPDAADSLRERTAALLEVCRTPGADIGNLLTLLSGRAPAR